MSPSSLSSHRRAKRFVEICFTRSVSQLRAAHCLGPLKKNGRGADGLSCDTFRGCLSGVEFRPTWILRKFAPVSYPEVMPHECIYLMRKRCSTHNRHSCRISHPSLIHKEKPQRMSNILLRHLSMLISTLFKHQHRDEHFLLPTGEENLPRIRDRTSAEVAVVLAF